MKQFESKKRTVEAMQVGDPSTTWKKVAEWCGGEVIRENGRKNAAICIRSPRKGLMLWVERGEWIVKGALPDDPDGHKYHILTNANFQHYYEVTDARATH